MRSRSEAMAQTPRKSKKWTSLIKDISEKVGFSPRSPAPSRSPFAAAADGPPPAPPKTASDVSKKLAPEFVFKSSWEKFLSSNSEQEKEMALQTALDIFCKIVKHQHDVNEFVTTLVETHVFSFAIGRAFVANIEKVRISNKTKSLDASNIMDFFSMATQDGIKHGYNLLSTVEVLVSGVFDKQPLLDSGILSCLVQIMCVFLSHEEINKRQVSVISKNSALPEKPQENATLPMGQFEVEGSIIHIIKALASHPSSATCLIEDDSLKLLSQMVSSGSMNIFCQFKQGLVPLYTIQFYRHAMQILHLLLVNNNGNAAKYIHKHHLVKVLLEAVKDFNPEVDDSVYTIGILDILLECVELSYRPEAGSVRLREDIHNAHGYQLFVHFALKLSLVQSDNIQKSISSIPSSEGMDELSGRLSPLLSRLLDIIVSLAKIGPMKPDGSSSEIGSKQKILMEGHNKVYDLDAVQVLQNIFLKSDCVQLQTEVLNRIFKIFLDHLDNYRLCQELRIMPLFIINMPDISPELQGMIFKIVEYVVTVVNCVPEQELLSLCCLLQQPINCNLKGSVLSFFVKILSFDQLYQKVLWEVGLLEVLVDDMQQHKLNSGSDKLNGSPSEFERKFSSKSMKKLLEDKNAILSPRLEGHGFGKTLLFEEAGTISIAWECILSLLKKSEANQIPFRSDSGFDIVLPFLASDTHRPGALRLLSCLIIEDNMQVYPGALGALIEILKSGVVTSVFGIQYKVKNDAKCDILGSLWRILGSNNSARIVFGEATGFSLLLTILHSFQNEEFADAQLIKDRMKVVSFLFHVMVVAVSNNDINRSRLDTILSSQTFSDLLCETRLICLHWEEYIIQFLLELALEIILPPSNELQRRFVSTNTTETRESGTESLSSSGFLGSIKLDTGRVYNAGAVTVLIRSLLLFTPKVQLEILFIVEKLASVGSFNQENLTSKCCVGLLLDIIAPSLTISSPLLIQALRVVEVLGAYKLSMLELRVLVKYILQMKSLNSGHYLVDMMEKLIQKQDIVLENISLAPYVEMNMSKIGHASVQVTLGERTWPPAAGYTFVCWFQYQNLLKNPSSEQQQTKNDLHKGSVKQPNPVQSVLNLFSIGSMDDTSTTYTRIYIQERVLTLTMGNSSLSFSDMELEEGKWHHLAVVHSKPNALSGLFQANTAQVYLNGKLQHTGKLGYSPSIVGKSLHATIGTLSTHGKVCKLSWRLRCCYLFEEVLTAGSLCFMYILGRGYRGIFQDTDLLQFVPHQACGGDSMAILESLDAEPVTMSSMKKVDGSVKRKRDSSDGTGVIWDLNRLTNLSLDLIRKKLIFAFDGTSSDARGMFGVPLLLNLVDPTSAAASPVGGIPLIGRLHGDSYICHQCVIGDDIRAIGGIPVVLALVESAETRDMLHMALALLASALHQNPQNVLDMQACRGYHLIAIFLYHKMPLFDMQSLDIFFQIAACEASFQKPPVLQGVKNISSPDRNSETTFPDTSSPNISHEISSVEFEQGTDEYSILEKVNTPFSEFHSAEMPEDTSKCVVISNSDMVEHVLIDWTLWVTTPVSIQLAVLGFLEQMVTMDGYRSHNLTLLREINLVEHLLVILQRDDVDMHVLEKLVVLLGVILDDGFLATELDAVVRFVIMTFDPPLLNEQDIFQETMGKHVTIRNLLLEMLIDLRLTITSEELLEQWHGILSLKFIMIFLDEAVHPSSMRWIMTLLGVWLSSSPTFAHEFHSGGGYQILTHVLPSFCDYLEIYYILFCLILGKPVYPRLPEVIIEDFHALMSCDGCQEELTFVELLDSVIAMTKFNFDRVNMQIASAHNTDNILYLYPAEDTTNTEVNILAETPSHAVLQNGNAAAIGTATYVLRFMADLAKMSPSFSSICRRPEFLGSCVDLYFSCVRIECAKKLAQGTEAGVAEARSSIANDDCRSTLQMSPGLPEVQEQSSEISDSVGSFPQGLGTIFERNPEQENVIPVGNVETEEGTLKFETDISSKEDLTANHSFHPEDIEQSQQSTQLGSPRFTGRPTPGNILKPSASPILALTSWLGSRGVSNVLKDEVRKKRRSLSLGDEVNLYPELEIDTEIPSDGDKEMIISPNLLLEVNSLKHEGCKSSTGVTEILDFVGVVLADVVLEQSKASQCVENTLEAVPLYIPVDSALVFQGLCLDRMMHFLERRLVRDDEEEREKKLDKSIWSVNLGALCWTIVDHVYMGSFPQPVAVLKVLEFLFSMLELANIDGCIEKATPLGKGLLSMTRANRQLGSHVHALLKSLNRMIMYCFLPYFLTTINEYSFLAYCGFQTMPNRALPRSFQDEPYVDICSVLQMVSAHKQLVFCPSNLDTDLICCLCVNLIYLLRDKRKNARGLAVDIIKYLLLNRRSTLEELLASKPHQGQNLNVLHGGFDQLLRDSSKFFDWLHRSEQTINLVLEQCAALMWEKYILGSSKFPGIRIKAMEGRHKREMERKSHDVSKMDSRYGEHRNRTRNQLKKPRDSMINELRVIRQNKYGWVLHAESEWQSHMQQLIHERGIIPMQNSFLEPEWQLCPIEGPYRMRKKLELCKLKVEMIQNFLNGGLVTKENYPSQRIEERGFIIPESGPDSLLNLLSDGQKQSGFDEAEYEELYLDAEYKGETLSSRSGWDGEQCSSVNEASLHSAHDSDEMYGSMKGQPDVGSPRLSSFTEIDSLGVVTETENKLHDNGEYLIRPYLEPLERIRFKYNCERVMGLDKHDGVFLIGDRCLYVIENFYIDDLGCFCEKQNEDELSVIEQALGVKRDLSCSSDIQSKPSSTSGETVKPSVGARAWACDDATWGKKKVHRSGALPHAWNMWKLESISELLKRDYQLQPVAVEIFSTDGCNDLLIFHKKEREDVFKNLVSLNLPRNNMLDNTISGSSKEENAEGSRFFKTMAKSFSKRWQNGEISNFQYLMHLNTLAGRGYGDLTQYPVFPWVLADYESETLDLTNHITFRKLDKPMGCQTEEGEEEFKRRYEIWDDPDVPKFHYGSHYSSSGIVLFYLLRLPPFSKENQKLQGGQFDRADRLFNSIRDTWLSAVGKGNTSDVKELIPEFYYMPEFLENHFNLDLGEKQSGEKVCNVELPPWAKGSAREFIRKHREALECDYISENLHHWIDLIFGYKQRGEAAEEAVNVFYHYTYEGSVDIDSISDPAMKAAILAQINHFGQTPKQLFFKPHVKRNTHMKIPHYPLYYCKKLLPHEVRTSSSSISQIVSLNEKVLVARKNNVLRPVTYSEYIAWGFPDRSLRFVSYEQDKILSTHESLHGGHQIQCVGVSHDSQILVTGGDNGSVMVWRICKAGARILQHLMLLKVLCGHIARITCLYVSQPYSLIVTGSDDCSVIVWDLSGLAFVRQLSRFPSPVSAVHVNDLTGEIVTAAGILLSVWSINGDCLATVDTSQLPSDLILSITTATFSDWKDTNLYATGHRSGAVKIWKMVHHTSHDVSSDGNSNEGDLADIALDGNAPEYRLILQKVLKTHKHSVTALHLASDQKQLLSGDSTGCLISWRLPDDDEIT